jgi:hypothetical protein
MPEALLDKLRETFDAAIEDTIRARALATIEAIDHDYARCPDDGCTDCLIIRHQRCIIELLDQAERLPQSGDAIVADPVREAEE